MESHRVPDPWFGSISLVVFLIATCYEIPIRDMDGGLNGPNRSATGMSVVKLNRNVLVPQYIVTFVLQESFAFYVRCH